MLIRVRVLDNEGKLMDSFMSAAPPRVDEKIIVWKGPMRFLRRVDEVVWMLPDDDDAHPIVLLQTVHYEAYTVFQGIEQDASNGA